MFQLSSAHTKMALAQTQPPKKQSSLPLLDLLYCEEKCWEDEYYYEEEKDDHAGISNISPEFDIFPSEDHDEEVQLVNLLSKEEKSCFCEGDDLDASMSLFMAARRETLEWMIKVKHHHNFSVVTLVLCVSYFDRFMMSYGFQKDRPWMTHLVAVACLSLASKMEETHVPLLLDFQVESKYIFEAKTIQRMELLVMSTLKWKMNAVTPLSYFGYLMKGLKFKSSLHWDIFCSCECLVLSAIVDPRFLCYVPSVIAAATMLQILKELELYSPMDHHKYVLDILKLNKDKVEECQKFIREFSSNDRPNKRKYPTSANSPRSVLDAVTSESSKDSSVSSLLPSPESLPKKSRTLGPHSSG